MAKQSVEQKLEEKRHARLIPIFQGSQKEAAAVSVLLAVFRIIPEYAQTMLKEVGAPWSARSKLKAFTEICFSKPKKSRQSLPRPDGLLIVDTSRKEWSALIEAKIQKQELSPEQIEKYLDLAKEHGVDAVITISNQYATNPSHHPVSVDRRKLKGVDLYHFSWISILSNAELLAQSNKVDDREQAMILKELIMFLKNPKSGVEAFDRMGTGWRDLSMKIQNAVTPGKNDPDLIEAASDWLQLTRYLSLTLSANIGKRVEITLSRKHQKDSSERFSSHLTTMIDRCRFTDSFTIPNTAGEIKLESDFRRRTIGLEMRVKPPGDKKRPTAAINWLTKQLRDGTPGDTLIICHWPGRLAATAQTLEHTIQFPEDLVPDGANGLPTSFDVRQVTSLGARFKGAKTLVEDCEKCFVSFYQSVGQKITPWTPPPPKYKRPKSESDFADEVDGPEDDLGDVAVDLSG